MIRWSTCSRIIGFDGEKVVWCLCQGVPFAVAVEKIRPATAAETLAYARSTIAAGGNAADGFGCYSSSHSFSSPPATWRPQRLRAADAWMGAAADVANKVIRCKHRRHRRGRASVSTSRSASNSANDSASDDRSLSAELLTSLFLGRQSTLTWAREYAEHALFGDGEQEEAKGRSSFHADAREMITVRRRALSYFALLIELVDVAFPEGGGGRGKGDGEVEEVEGERCGNASAAFALLSRLDFVVRPRTGIVSRILAGGGGGGVSGSTWNEPPEIRVAALSLAETAFSAPGMPFLATRESVDAHVQQHFLSALRLYNAPDGGGGRGGGGVGSSGDVALDDWAPRFVSSSPSTPSLAAATAAAAESSSSSWAGLVTGHLRVLMAMSRAEDRGDVGCQSRSVGRGGGAASTAWDDEENGNARDRTQRRQRRRRSGDEKKHASASTLDEDDDDDEGECVGGEESAGSDAVTRSFRRLRVLDFLVREINLEYEMSQRILRVGGKGVDATMGEKHENISTITSLTTTTTTGSDTKKNPAREASSPRITTMAATGGKPSIPTLGLGTKHSATPADADAAAVVPPPHNHRAPKIPKLGLNLGHKSSEGFAPPPLYANVPSDESDDEGRLTGGFTGDLMEDVEREEALEKEEMQMAAKAKAAGAGAGAEAQRFVGSTAAAAMTDTTGGNTASSNEKKEPPTPRAVYVSDGEKRSTTTTTMTEITASRRVDAPGSASAERPMKIDDEEGKGGEGEGGKNVDVVAPGVAATVTTAAAVTAAAATVTAERSAMDVCDYQVMRDAAATLGEVSVAASSYDDDFDAGDIEHDESFAEMVDYDDEEAAAAAVAEEASTLFFDDDLVVVDGDGGKSESPASNREDFDWAAANDMLDKFDDNLDTSYATMGEDDDDGQSSFVSHPNSELEGPRGVCEAYDGSTNPVASASRPPSLLRAGRSPSRGGGATRMRSSNTTAVASRAPLPPPSPISNTPPPRKENPEDSTATTTAAASVSVADLTYVGERGRRRLYREERVHVAVLELLLVLLAGTDVTRRIKRQQKQPGFPSPSSSSHQATTQLRLGNLKQNVTFFLRTHMNHPGNASIVPAVASAASRLGRDAERLLRLSCDATFHPGRYGSRNLVARGAYAQVHRCALPAELGTLYSSEVALKIVDAPQSAHDPPSAVDVYSEIAVLESMAGEPRVAKLLDYGVAGESFFIIMQHYPASLKQWRAGPPAHHGQQQHHQHRADSNHNRFGIDDIKARMTTYLAVYSQCIDAVTALEKYGVVHYDVKADNFLLEPEPGCSPEKFWNPPLPQIPSTTTSLSQSLSSSSLPFRVVITDFGESRLFAAGDTAGTAHNRGTEYVKSPEMLTISNAAKKDAKTYDRRRYRYHKCGRPADVWALGCLLYEILTNDYMLYDADWIHFFLRTVTPNNDLLPPKSAAKLKHFPELKEFILWVLVRDPELRPKMEDVRVRFAAVRRELVGGSGEEGGFPATDDDSASTTATTIARGGGGGGLWAIVAGGIDTTSTTTRWPPAPAASPPISLSAFFPTPAPTLSLTLAVDDVVSDIVRGWRLSPDGMAPAFVSSSFGLDAFFFSDVASVRGATLHEATVVAAVVCARDGDLDLDVSGAGGSAGGDKNDALLLPPGMEERLRRRVENRSMMTVRFLRTARLAGVETRVVSLPRVTARGGDAQTRFSREMFSATNFARDAMQSLMEPPPTAGGEGTAGAGAVRGCVLLVGMPHDATAVMAVAAAIHVCSRDGGVRAAATALSPAATASLSLSSSSSSSSRGVGIGVGPGGGAGGGGRVDSATLHPTDVARLVAWEARACADATQATC